MTRKSERLAAITRRTAIGAIAAPWVSLRAAAQISANSLFVHYPGGRGLGQGKRVVLISGDEEYRSEEALPQLGKILSHRHGFACTVLFAIDPRDGVINPETTDNIPGLETLRQADLMIVATRFRNLPDEQMREIDAYVHSGRPILGLRTATHAFNFPADSPSAYKHYSWNHKGEWPGGFGKQVLGETWVSHHGHHAVQSTRGRAASGAERLPMLRGCEDIWGPSDVYTAAPPADATLLVMGEVLTGMNPTDPPVAEYVVTRGGKQISTRPNQPMMPITWIREFTGRSGKKARVFTTTMGAATDLESEGTRRMIVNGALWAVGMERRIPRRTNVDLVGDYQPTPFGFGKYRRGLRPSDFA
ncbi:MAG: ThuA domain-containing protein [Bryobacterales bacterium]|nr:ThuA domain-containing protein [Bryobacterales bacterium]